MQLLYGLAPQFVGRCARCKYPYLPHALRLPVKPSLYVDELGNLNPITHVEIYANGCKCGDSKVELVKKNERFYSVPWKK
jgi:hypothetical protein